jgi:hypothetical protein
MGMALEIDVAAGVRADDAVDPLVVNEGGAASR